MLCLKNICHVLCNTFFVYSEEHEEQAHGFLNLYYTCTFLILDINAIQHVTNWYIFIFYIIALYVIYM